MANVQISALPSTTSTTFNDWVIKNDSGETTTSKVQLKDMLGMVPGSATNSVQTAKWITDLGTTANTIGSIAIGPGAEATSDYSIAIGYEALNFNRDGNRQYYIAIGYQAQSISEGVAMGKDARTLATAGFAIGNSTRVYGNGGFALGNNAQSYGNDGIAIGTNSRDNTGLSGLNNGVAIGPDARVDHEEAVSLGRSVQSIYSSTTHVQNIHIYGQASNKVQDLGSGSSFNIDFNEGQSVEMTLTGNSNCTLLNVKDGGQYRVKITTTGSYNVTGITASGYSVLLEGGGFSLTPNGTDMCILNVFAGDILVTHFADFS